jgi:hypothetical protein
VTYVDGVNAEALDKFLGALESGEYRQGQQRLHTVSDGSMCCLGVATDVLGPECGVTLQTRASDDISRKYLVSATGKQYYLLMPPEVTEYLGIPEKFLEPGNTAGDTILVPREEEDDEHDFDFYTRGEVDMVAVSSLNDQGYSFTEIARRIREALTKKEN